MTEQEIKTEEGKEIDKAVSEVFGEKIAMGLIAQSWQIKEICLKIIYKTVEKQLQKESEGICDDDMRSYVQASVAAVELTAKDKVVKVFNISL
jgi:hypothetical protein